jgi:hypothetical protein
MATAAGATAERRTPVEGTRFFLIMALVMAGVIVAGFTFHLAMGRSSFGSPPVVHVHGIMFMAWTGLYLAQAISISRGAVALHRQLGRLAYLFVPAMVIAGTAVMYHAAVTRGGPFFFAVNEFVISNTMGLWGFGFIALWALRVRRYSGWHRRLMLVAMSILTGPGLGRLLPTPFLIPYAWPIAVGLTWVFPLIGMWADWRRDGRVHPAYWWGMGVNVGVFVASMLLANSPAGIAFTEALIAGTPGAERPMGAYLPPGFGS